MKIMLVISALILGLTSFAQAVTSGEKVFITIHANIDPATTAPTWLGRLKRSAEIVGNGDAYQLLAEAESVSAGHAWISVKQGAVCKTYGLFDGGPKVDQERKYGQGVSRSLEISQSQLSKLQMAIHERLEYQWMGYCNCASYATDLWKEATGEVINPVPSKVFYVDSRGDRRGIKSNIRIKPLPPSPIGVIQEIIRLGNGTTATPELNVVCPETDLQ